MPLPPPLPMSPLPNPDAVLQGQHWRITVVTDGLVRLEWSPDGGFEDRASTLALHRDLPVPEFTVTEIDAVIQVVTERFTLVYDRGPFSPAGLSLQVAGDVSAYRSVYRFGEPADDLGGTARTLDEVDGRTPLEPGVASAWGFSVLEDSESFLFEADGWVGSRVEGRLDLYVFAYGHDHQAAIDAFYALSGPQPLIPRWALGNWWSRYHPYSAETFLQLLDRFAAERLPFSVVVIDMDWHPVAIDPRHGSGWTGYSWNRELFADPAAFLAELHRRGLHVTLNVHPADGVRAFEDAYEEMAEALGVDPQTEAPIAFDVTDKTFLEAYLGVLHHPHEDDGVDFWWLDWQSGRYSRQPGVDPLWMLNHFHYLDSARDARPPLTFSRYAGPGSHRYPIGFSGDAVITWNSLDFQPEFTATAANIGYGWWSHDIGGHMWGYRDDELALRWMQLGVFSPILRLHSGSNPFVTKEPSRFGADTAAAMAEALRLRHRLVPYLHSMNHRAADRGRALVRPMYHLYPREQAAYRVPNQFAFGSQMLVAPITTPRDPVTRLGSVRAWLPPGVWTDAITGTVYDGGREVVVHRDERSIPVLLRAGAIVALDAASDTDAGDNPTALELLVAPGADGAFDLVEDDGRGPSQRRTARTPITWEQSSGTLRIGPASGPPGVVPASRTWTVTLAGARRTEIRTDVAAGTGAQVTFGPDPQPRTGDLRARIFALLDRAQYGHEAKARIWSLLDVDQPTGRELAELYALDPPPSLFSALAELLTARV